jgi:U4/U6.U5 tri-snRNP-associated protein 1
MSGVQSVAYTPLPSEMLKSGVTSVIPRSDFLLRKRSMCIDEDEKGSNEAASQQNETVDPQNMSSLAEIMDEDDQSKGIMGTLNLLRKRGLLGQTEYSGRYKDRNPDKEMEKFPKSASDRIKLEYRDHKGKLMTSKEAFRYGCWIFHNKKPGKKKMEKKLLREQVEEKLRNKDASLDSKFMNFLKAEQEKSHLPYVVIQKK